MPTWCGMGGGGELYKAFPHPLVTRTFPPSDPAIMLFGHILASASSGVGFYSAHSEYQTTLVTAEYLAAGLVLLILSGQ
jgi:hypothetical protein